MAIFERKPYARGDVLDRAARALARGDRRQAIAEYRRLLEHEPGDELALTRLGDLLAQEGEHDEAKDRLVHAVHGYERRGFDDKALAVLALAVTRLPGDAELVVRYADKLGARGRRAEAARALLAARARLGRRDRTRAIDLLRRVLALQPAHEAATLDLARLVARQGDRDQAHRLLEALAGASTGPALRRVRRAQFVLAPGLRTAWGWLRGR